MEVDLGLERKRRRRRVFLSVWIDILKLGFIKIWFFPESRFPIRVFGLRGNQEVFLGSKERGDHGETFCRIGLEFWGQI